MGPGVPLAKGEDRVGYSDTTGRSLRLRLELESAANYASYRVRNDLI